ncbi:hypothetical protein [Sphingobium scionense]|uniref:Uncharacterized protein n=1 Tax=Sphingobium scionense TaxID=1404341 RepID=A0A7W6LX41_9SPHN|nr:hypothetical protein [Sphingobium scionense]MBB4151031.1 hypothetical protein [Sphingobium scionense]
MVFSIQFDAASLLRGLEERSSHDMMIKDREAAMFAQARYAYHENSMLFVQYVLTAQMIFAAVALAVHIISWMLGAPVGFFDTPALLTAVAPVMRVMLLPSLGWAAGLIANWFLDDTMDEAGPYQLIGDAAGQAACLLLFPKALALSAIAI